MTTHLQGILKREKVENGEREEALGGEPIRPLTSVQLESERDEDRSTGSGGGAKEEAGKAQGARQQRNWHQQDTVDQDLPCRCRRSCNHRQHRDASATIFVGTIERQRPEMGRRP